MSSPSPTPLYAEYGGLTDAGRVADRQGDHLSGVGRYVTDVCGRTEAFRGFLRPFAGTYDDAVALAVDGVAGSGRAAGRWADAARDTAAGLAEADAVVRRAVSAIAGELPGAPWALPPAPAPAAGPLVPGGPPTSPVGPEPPALGGSPLPLDDLTGLDPDLPDLLTPMDRDGPFGTLAGQGRTGWADGGDLLDATLGIGHGRSEADATAEDRARYVDFLGGDR